MNGPELLCLKGCSVPEMWVLAELLIGIRN